MAYVWYAMAGKAGDKEADTKSKTLAKRMTSSQLKQARQLMGELRKKMH